MRRRSKKALHRAVETGEPVSGGDLLDAFDLGTKLNAVARHRLQEGLRKIGIATVPDLALAHTSTFRLYTIGSPVPQAPDQHGQRAHHDRLPLTARAALKPHQVEIERRLARAVSFATDGNVKGEESEIRSAAAAGQADPRYLDRRLGELVRGRKLRRSKYLGFAGDVHFWKDRIVDSTTVRIFDQLVHATVETAGQLAESQRPTLTRMAIGSVLPGTALIPGMALQKKSVTDYRELFLLIEHPEWARVIAVDPRRGHEIRELAAAINLTARELGKTSTSSGTTRSQRGGTNKPGSPSESAVGSPSSAPQPITPTVPTLVEQLRQLVELRDAGALTEAEFQVAKAKVLDDGVPGA